MFPKKKHLNKKGFDKRQILFYLIFQMKKSVYYTQPLILTASATLEIEII